MFATSTKIIEHFTKKTTLKFQTIENSLVLLRNNYSAYIKVVKN